MALKKDTKTNVIQKFKQHESDTGSPEVQIALLTERINQLVEHLKKNKNDNHSRRGLLILVGQRKRLMNYLKGNDQNRLEKVTSSLGI
ncbi:MAG: 30S ribosomal protein S15 [Candidatus Margulisiibacteriota bacterium]